MTESQKNHGKAVERFRPDLGVYEDIYKSVHQKPELPKQEAQTASTYSKFLKDLGFRTHTGIGGHGVAGVLENGQGKTVLLRAELDALPIEERTGLPYCSKRRMTDEDGREKPVMHACGHDMNATSLLAASELLASARKEWNGTLITVFQPNEERAGGADAMVKGGLYNIVPKPDVLLAQHVWGSRAGDLNIGDGAVMTAASTLNVRIFGRSGHGSEPHSCIDPVVIAGYIIVRLQSIVSREADPKKTAVITCGSIHGGEAANVIPDHVDLRLNVRTYDEALHEEILDSIRRTIHLECEASKSPRKAQIDIFDRFPPTVNDQGLASAVRTSFSKYFGSHLAGATRATASEDFSVLARAIGAPYAYWFFGGTPVERYDEALKQGKLSELPSNHSSYFALDLKSALRTGTDAMALAALTCLGE